MASKNTSSNPAAPRTVTFKGGKTFMIKTQQKPIPYGSWRNLA